MKVIHKIPFTAVESIPQLIKDFLDGKHEKFHTEVFSLDNFRLKISEKDRIFGDEQRKILHEVLTDQTSDLPLTSSQSNNLSQVVKSNTFTVTTGHQLNLFSGPVFFIYKILQTVKTAAFLQINFPDLHFIPLFWMATEDHDFEEINHFRTANNYYEIKGVSGGAVGRIELSENRFIEDFEQEFTDHIFGTELILMLKEAYISGNTLAQATRTIVNRLFADYGLLVIDGDDARLKAQMQDCFRDELLGSKLLQSTSSAVDNLRKEYGKVQVNPRDINLFFLEGTRNRIDRSGDGFKVDETDRFFTQGEMLDQLAQFPQKFSPNALMRPIYQEKILPNIAYIGGNAEIMYWLELKDYFESVKLPFPVLIPRNSILFLKEKTVKKISKTGLEIPDFIGDFSKATNKKLLQQSTVCDVLQEKKILLQKIFSDILNVACRTDVTFENLVKAEETRQLKSFIRMEKRLLRAERKKQHELLARLDRIFREIHPGGIWQERVWNFSVFYADYGRQWLETCLEEMDVQKSELIIIAD